MIKIFPILGVFQARRCVCLHCDLWGFMPWDQYSHSGDNMWPELHVWG